MKTVIFDFLDIVNRNMEHIERGYPSIRDVLEQIDILLKDNPTDKQILEWMLSNQDTITEVNKYIKSVKKNA